MARLATILALCAAGAALGACASNTKGAWTCPTQQGGTCAEIAEIDHHQGPWGVKQRRTPVVEDDPVIAGAIPAKLWGEGGWPTGPVAGAPVRENDVYLRVAIAPWIDGAGDYHGATDVYAIVRRGGWYTSQPTPVQKVNLSAAALYPTAAGASHPVDFAAAGDPAPPTGHLPDLPDKDAHLGAAGGQPQLAVAPPLKSAATGVLKANAKSAYGAPPASASGGKP